MQSAASTLIQCIDIGSFGQQQLHYTWLITERTEKNSDK